MDNLEWRQQAADALIAAGLYLQAAKLVGCRHPEHFSRVRVCRRNPAHAPRTVPFTCKLRICPLCNEARKHQLVKHFLPPMLALLAATPDYSAKFITLTTPFPVTEPNASVRLRATAQAANRALENVLRKHVGIATRAERVKGRMSFKAHGIGYVRNSEFGDEGLKLHHHILFVGPDLPHTALVEEWSDATHGHANVVRIERAFTRQQLKRQLEYTTKTTRLAPEFAPDLFRAYNRIHRVQAYGALHGIGKHPPRHELRCQICNSRLDYVTRRSYEHWLAHTPVKYGLVLTT